MTKTKHTPGPWRLVEDAQGPCMIMHPDADGVAIASLTDTHKPVNGFVTIESPGASERSANGLLIVTSPELLETLQAALKQVEFERLPFRAWHDKARDVIAKATGEKSEAA